MQIKETIAPFMPGICLAAGDVGKALPVPKSLGTIPKGLFLHKLSGSRWLTAAVTTRLEREAAVHACDTDNFQVLFDGYLTDIVGTNVTVDWTCRPAGAIAELYRSYGESFFSWLRGSYTFLIVDHGERKALLVSDRKGSRPSFYIENGGCVQVAPTVYSLYQVSRSGVSLDSASAIEFLLTGAYRDRYTLFRNIYRSPKAGVLEINGEGRSKVWRYWRLEFKPQSADETQLIEQCDAVLRQAIKRISSVYEDKVLALSGGLDSRVVLAYLNEVGSGKTAVTCFWERGTKGDDAQVAQRIARHLDLPIISYEFDMHDFEETAQFATMLSDCGAEVVDSAPLTLLWEQLGDRFQGYINGDECFGWHGLVSTERAAFTEIRWYRLQQAARLADWLDPDVRAELECEIDERLKALAKASEEKRPNALKDWLYYEERLGKMLNAFSASKLRYLEPLRPLIDEDVIEFISTVPDIWRDDKKLLRKTFARKFPELHAIPYATEDVLPIAESFRKRLIDDPRLQKYFRDHLIDGLPLTLRSLFDEKRFQQTFFALVKGESLPPVGRGVLARIPGLWRYRKQPENRVAPVAAMLRLLQLSLYVQALEKE